MGSRAHATLALAAGISAVETGLDALRIVDAELEGRPDASQRPMPSGDLLREILVPSPNNPNTSHESIFYYQYRMPRGARISYAAFY